MDFLQINSWISDGRQNGSSYIIIYQNSSNNNYFPVFIHANESILNIRYIYEHICRYIKIAIIKLDIFNKKYKLYSRLEPVKIRTL